MLDFIALSRTERDILTDAAKLENGTLVIGGLPNRFDLVYQNAALNLIDMGLCTFLVPDGAAPARWAVQITKLGRDVLAAREARDVQKAKRS